MMRLEQRGQDRWLQAVLKHIKTHDLFRAGEKILVCSSGGLDSTVLLHLLSRAADLLDIDLEAVHVDHQTRGGSSSQEGVWVEVLASRLGVPCHRLSLSPSPRARTQAEMREARRALMEDLADEKACRKMVTAHHADDNAETLLMRLMSGSGINGLRGMAPRSGRWMKPLLIFTKEELRDYAAQYRLGWVEDPSNARSDYLRNALRNEVFPRLEEIRKSSVRNMARLAERIEEEEAEWEAWIRQELGVQAEGKISVGWLEKWPLTLQRRILRTFLALRGYHSVPAWVEILLKKQDLLTPTGSFIYRSDTLIFSAEDEFSSQWSLGMGPLTPDRRYDLGRSHAWSFWPGNPYGGGASHASFMLQFRAPSFEAPGLAKLSWESLPWPLALRVAQKNDPHEWIEAQLRQAGVPTVFWRSWPLLVGHENQDLIGVLGIAYLEKYLFTGLKRCVCILPFFEESLRAASQS